MTEEIPSPRIRLIRDALELQAKLLVDGFRDALLIPISIAATVVGVLRGGDDCDREFRRVIKLGRRSERWINLFGNQRSLNQMHPAGSMDQILGQVESVVIDQYRKGRSAAETRDAVRRAMKDENGEADSQ
jgi:hypothetical protein